MKIIVITNGREYRGLEIEDGRAFTSADPVADFSRVLQALVADGMTVAMRPEDLGRTERSAGTPARSDALTDRVNAWVSLALTKAKVSPVPDTDKFAATLPPFRKFCGLSETEAAALDDLRDKLIEHARHELVSGRELHTWEATVPEITEAMKYLVRMSNLRRELKCRAEAWGGKRQLLPAGAVERCLADIDALVTRHAMQIQGVTPPQG